MFIVTAASRVRYDESVTRWVAGVVLVLCACAEEERAPFFDATQYRQGPTRELLEREDMPGDLVRCDIREDDCQAQLFRATADARGTDALRPPVQVVSPSAFEQEIASEGGGAPFPEDDLRMLTLLGLVSPVLTTSEVSQSGLDSILAVYFHMTDEVVVVDRGYPLDDELASLVLSHEYVHALQDAEHDLTALGDGIDTTDEVHGFLGLVEGEAELYAGIVIAGDAQDDDRVWQRLRGLVLEDVLASDAPFFAADLNFPYTYGHEFVTSAWLDGGNAAVGDLYDPLPRSSRQVLSRATGPVPAGGWSEAIGDTAMGEVATGFEAVLEDAFGSWIFHVFVEQMALAAGAAEPRLPGESVASELRGDRVLAFTRDSDMVVVWRLRFEPTVAPGEVIAEVEAGAPAHFRLREEGGDVLLFAGEPAAALDEFVEAFTLPAPGATAARPRLPALPRRGAVHLRP